MLISEVAARSGVSVRMLRHYDALGLVTPGGRTDAGYREYAGDDLVRIAHVEGLRSLGLSLRQVAEALDDPAFDPSSLVSTLVAQVEERLRRDRELLERLRAVEASGAQDWPDALRVVELLSGLGSSDAARRQRAALGASPPSTTVVPALASALIAEEDPHVAGALRWALARAGEAARAPLARALRSRDPGVRGRAVAAMAELSPSPGVLDALTAALEDEDDGVRGRAALALGAVGRTEAVPALLSLVVTGDHDVEASEVLADLAGEGAVGHTVLTRLLELLGAADTAPEARVRLVQALSELPPQVGSAHWDGLVVDDDPRVARAALACRDAVRARSARG